MKGSGLLHQRPPGGIVVAVWGGPERPCRAPGTGHRAPGKPAPPSRALALPSFLSRPLPVPRSLFFLIFPVFLCFSLPPPSLSSFLLPTRTAGRRVALTSARAAPSQRRAGGRRGDGGDAGGRARLSPPGRWAPRCAPARALAGLSPRARALRALCSASVLPQRRRKTKRGAPGPGLTCSGAQGGRSQRSAA